MLPRSLREYVRTVRQCCDDIRRGDVSAATAESAAAVDHVDCMRRVGKENLDYDRLAETAVSNKSTECLKELMPHVRRKWMVAKRAVEVESMECLRIAQNHVTWHSAQAAARLKDGRFLKHVITVMGAGWTRPVWSRAAVEAGKEGRLKNLAVIAASADGEWSQDEVAMNAARTGREKIMRFAMNSGASAVVQLTVAAASSGSRECVQLALERGCGWNTDVTAAALRHRELLHWLINSGCPYDMRVLDGDHLL